MKNKNYIDFFAFAFWLLPLLYLYKNIQHIPQSAPVHFGINGRPDRYASHSEFIWTMIFFSLLAIAMYFLFKFLPKIDPKKAAIYSSGIFKNIAFLLVCFMSGIQVLMIKAAISGGNFDIKKFVLPGVGIFFAILGNLMYNVKPNYFFGIRTPWALEAPENWKATHRLGGKVWTVGGLVLAILTFLFPGNGASIIFLIIISIMVLIPVIYSYLFFKKKQNQTL